MSQEFGGKDFPLLHVSKKDKLFTSSEIRIKLKWGKLGDIIFDILKTISQISVSLLF